VNPPPGRFTYRIVHQVDGATVGMELFDRCPKAFLRDEIPDAPDLISDHRWLRAFNVLPCVGAKLEQDPRFITAVEVLETEVAREEQARRRRRGKASE